MELLLLASGLVALDILALLFGADSRVLDPRARHEWWPATPAYPSSSGVQDYASWYQAERLREAAFDHLASVALGARPSLRSQLARKLNALADWLEPPVADCRCPEPAC